MSQHAVIWWCVYGCTAGFEGVCEGMQGLRSWVELWIYEDEVWEARRARRGRGSSMPGDNQESEETECSGSRGEVYGCLTWWTCCMADVIGFEMPQLIESKPFYVRWSKLLLMVYMVGMSRQCPAICICKFIMQLVLQVHYAACQCVYVLLPIALLPFINHSILQWSAIYRLWGNTSYTTRVSWADENLINLILCSGNYSRKIWRSIIWGLIPTWEAPKSRSAPHPHLSISMKASNETTSFSTWTLSSITSLNPSIQLSRMQNSPNGMSMNGLSLSSPWWQIQAKLSSPSWVSTHVCFMSHLCLSLNPCWTALLKYYAVVAQLIAQCEWGGL